MIINDWGLIVQHEWARTPVIRPDMNLTLGEFVIMPNHFHGIICIGPNAFNTEWKANKFGPQSKNLGTIIGGFKASVTKQIREIDTVFGWQERYHDHIIKNEEAYTQIQQYIYNNPVNWKNDKFY